MAVEEVSTAVVAIINQESDTLSGSVDLGREAVASRSPAFLFYGKF
jgi:hypothetical protein